MAKEVTFEGQIFHVGIITDKTGAIRDLVAYDSHNEVLNNLNDSPELRPNMKATIWKMDLNGNAEMVGETSHDR